MTPRGPCYSHRNGQRTATVSGDGAHVSTLTAHRQPGSKLHESWWTSLRDLYMVIRGTKKAMVCTQRNFHSAGSSIFMFLGELTAGTGSPCRGCRRKSSTLARGGSNFGARLFAFPTAAFWQMRLNRRGRPAAQASAGQGWAAMIPFPCCRDGLSV